MRISINKVLYSCLLVFLFFININANGQEIIVHGKDTLIAITKTDLKTLNCIIVDFENTKDLLQLYKNLSKMDSVLINDKDSIISSQNNIIVRKDKIYSERINILENDLKKEKRKKKLWIGIISGLAAILGILSIK